MPIDYLIVGQGLAGSLLAWELIQRNCKVIIVDNGNENASKIAAGLINPITGMRWVKSLNVDILLPSAINYYAGLSQKFNSEFYINKPILRLVQKPAELVHLQKRQQDLAYQPYLGTYKPKTQFKADFGTVEQAQTGYVLIASLLKHLHEFFLQQQSYQQLDFQYSEIKFSPQLHWRNFNPKKIIFCEGFQAQNNPYFAYLPFQVAKGEILTIASSEFITDKILQYGNWLLPLNNNHYRLGATFDPVHLNTDITQDAKTILSNNLHARLPNSCKFKVIQQQANIRPCTLDKQAFIGLHPQHPELAIFNGFGAKGSLQIPYYAQQFSQHLITKTPLNSNIDIQRYHKTV